jgi:inner membrane protein
MLGVVQQGRAHALGAELAAARGHSPERMSARPSFGNLLVWRLVYVRDGQVHADALRLGPLGTQVYPGASARLLDIQADFPWAPVGSVARRDLERFAFFSTGLLIEHPQRPGFIGDARYAMSPDSLRPLWGIEFAANEAGVQASWVTDRSMSEAERARFFALLRGDQALLDQ